MTNSAKKPLIVLTGPTSVGKTSLSIQLAKAVGGEIISADSIQVYRGMDIGSAKISLGEMQGISHHLIDILDPKDSFHIVLFQQLAKQAIEECYERGHVPILVGGTGFYIQAVTKDIDFSLAEQQSELRGELEALAKEKGASYLHQLLWEVDPESAAKIHENNVKRVIRALEFYRQNGTPISSHNLEQKAQETPYNLAYFVLTAPRELLYKRIDARVDEMIANGLVREVASLKEQGCHKGMVSMQGLGYKEILSYLDGEVSLEEAVRVLKRDTRHFAKRQMTWFRREPDVLWVKKEEFQFDDQRILEYLLSECTHRGILPTV